MKSHCRLIVRRYVRADIYHMHVYSAFYEIRRLHETGVSSLVRVVNIFL